MRQSRKTSSKGRRPRKTTLGDIRRNRLISSRPSIQPVWKVQPMELCDEKESAATDPMQVDAIGDLSLDVNSCATQTPAPPPSPTPIKEHLTGALAMGMEVMPSPRGLGQFMAKRDLRTTMKSTTMLFLPGTSSSVSYQNYIHRFHVIANDLYNWGSSDGNRPFGYDQLAAFYSYYEVHGVKLRCEFQNLRYNGTAAAPTPGQDSEPGPAHVAIFPISYPYSELPALYTDDYYRIENICEQPYVTQAFLSQPDGGKPWAVLERNFTTSQILGTFTGDEWNFKGETTAVPPSSEPESPINVWNYVIVCQSLNTSAAGGPGSGTTEFGPRSHLCMGVLVEIEYDVTFFDPKHVDPSG